MSYHQNRGRRYGGGRQSYRGNKSSQRRNTKENIHPSKFIKPAKAPRQENVYEPKHSFSDFKVERILQDAIARKGFSTPTPIQDQAIPLGLQGRDVVGIANTGTGKTVAFAVPVLNKVIADKQSSALIVAPTRELALQIITEFEALAKGSGLHGALLIGGAPMRPQLQELSKRPSIVIGTPGRIIDHVERGTLKLQTFNTLVLDEVDRMLDMGFINDMRTIISRLSPQKQSFFFSATMVPKVQTLIREFANDAETVSVKTGDTTDNVNQDVIRYSGGSDKMSKLHDVLIGNGACKALVFNETKRSVDKLSSDLRARGFDVDSIHGGKSQSQRQRALDKFKANKTNILVATDVAARGIDVVDITHVINYTTPQTYSDYTHRIGRAGRAGRIGHALTFIETR